MQFSEQRHHFLLDGVVECEAIVRCVVESALPTVREVAVVRETGVGAHLVTPLGQAIELAINRFGLLEPSIGNEFPRLLPPCAVGFLEVAAHLHEGAFFAVVMYREASDEFLVLLSKLGRLGLELDVLGPE